MYEISANKRNTIFIALKGDFNVEEAKELLGRIHEIVPTLQKGFTLLTDLTDLDSIALDARSFIEQAMDAFNSRGVARIVRVVPDSAKDIGFNIMSLFHYSKDVTILTYASFQEVVKHLL